MEFKVLKKDKKTKARVGKMTTLHGIVETPVFMPCGTQGTVKSLTPQDLKEIGIQILLGNTYHLYLRPGEKLIKQFGGLHKFMGWDGPILTDSGGYQVTSLGKARGPAPTFPPASAPPIPSKMRAVGSPSSRVTPRLLTDKDSSAKLVRIDDEGVTFRSHWDGLEHRFTPEKAIQIQQDLGVDIMMAFDEATPLGASHEYAREVMERTHRWALQCLKHYNNTYHYSGGHKKNSALFGIIQGGFYKDLRREAAKFINSLSFDGIAVGGGDVGSDLKKTERIFEWIADLLPKEKPIYAMGVGVYPQDILDIIKLGVDMFDCVAPTRLARSGILYTGKLRKKKSWFEFDSEFEKGRLMIQKAEFRADKKPIDKDCSCYTCRNFSRAYLHHLFRVRELLAYRLASYHNVYFMTNLVKQIRESIVRN